MILADFNPQIGIFEYKLEGDLTLDDMANYSIENEGRVFSRKVLRLFDATKATMKFSHEDLSILVDLNYKSIEKFDYVYDAIVLTSPRETALSILYKDLANTNKNRIQVYSTREAAIKWLKSTNSIANKL